VAIEHVPSFFGKVLAEPTYACNITASILPPVVDAAASRPYITTTMVKFNIFAGILACFIVVQTAIADSYNVKRCYCVSPTQVGYVTTYNWTSVPNDNRKYSWERHDTRRRDDKACRWITGEQCTSDMSECWRMPALWRCYKDLTDVSNPHNFKYACTTIDGKRICAHDKVIEVDGARTVMKYRKYEAKKVLDCSDECRNMWPEKDMKSACSHTNTNEKSKHYGEDVPNGYQWQGRHLRGMGIGSVQATCFEWDYPNFRLNTPRT